MANCCVNLSGSSCPVYNGYNQQIGELGNREFFTLIGMQGSLSAIYFMGPSGGMMQGYLQNPPAGVITGIVSRPYRTNVNPGDGQRYTAFIMRSQMSLYDYSGNIVGSVAAGKMVLCKTDLAGSSMYYLKAINYAERRAGGWEPMYESASRPYGFVDTGMRSSTGGNNIALYGSW
ncbi:MAG: hypothetical protein HFG28_14135 [Eubacterium sp.]|nr:hypothetical protein [uncultured Schaedlerella sp.]MCI9128277.1 hypothetical protein [Eubacterium sp.]